MSAIFLDAGPLGLVTQRRGLPERDACKAWLKSRLADGCRIIIPEIADYEIRRELLRARKVAGLERLDALRAKIDYLPITTDAMRLAAQFWADARKGGRPTADRHALDSDAIVAAQAATMGLDDFVVASTNVRHLSRFVHAKLWTEIR